MFVCVNEQFSKMFIDDEIQNIISNNCKKNCKNKHNDNFDIYHYMNLRIVNDVAKYLRKKKEIKTMKKKKK